MSLFDDKKEFEDESLEEDFEDLSDEDFEDDDFDEDDDEDEEEDEDEDDEGQRKKPQDDDDDDEEDEDEEDLEEKEEDEDESEDEGDEEEKAKKPEPTHDAIKAEDQPIEASAKDLPIKMKVEVGKVSMNAKQLLSLKSGNMIELGENPSGRVALVVNGSTVGHGELIKVGDVIGVRILEMGK